MKHLEAVLMSTCELHIVYCRDNEYHIMVWGSRSSHELLLLREVQSNQIRVCARLCIWEAESHEEGATHLTTIKRSGWQ